MNAFGEFQTSASSANLHGLRVYDLGWNAALSLVEGMVSLQGNRTALGFLDSRSYLRQFIDPAYRSELGRRLILPGIGGILGRLSSRSGEKSARFSAATFLPALLTFLERSCRIGLVGEDIVHLRGLREHFAHHAPWHEIIVVGPGQEALPALDFIIVDAATAAQEIRIAHWLAPGHAGLTIFAGAGLTGLLKNKPVRERPRSSGLLPQSLIGIRS
jgi:UDP-N-acetyl-D-mannosaminuronic acid transferase (WecB/TagA/CpsF family)